MCTYRSLPSLPGRICSVPEAAVHCRGQGPHRGGAGTGLLTWLLLRRISSRGSVPHLLFMGRPPHYQNLPAPTAHADNAQNIRGATLSLCAIGHRSNETSTIQFIGTEKAYLRCEGTRSEYFNFGGSRVLWRLCSSMPTKSACRARRHRATFPCGVFEVCTKHAAGALGSRRPACCRGRGVPRRAASALSSEKSRALSAKGRRVPEECCDAGGGPSECFRLRFLRCLVVACGFQDAVESGDYWKLQAAARSVWTAGTRGEAACDCNGWERAKAMQAAVGCGLGAEQAQIGGLLCDLSFVRPPGTPAEASDAYSQSSFRGAWFDQRIVQACSALAWQLGEPQASRELRKAAQVRIPGSCTPCLGDKVSSPTSKSGSGRELHIIPVKGIQMAET